jgi:hypothetical protein
MAVAAATATSCEGGCLKTPEKAASRSPGSTEASPGCGFEAGEGSDQGLVVVGAGCHGIDQMQELLDDRSVQWALLRFELGSKTFTRQKLLFLHLNGEDCPAVKRGQANALTAEAQRLLRSNNQEGFHASLSVTRRSEVTEEQLLERVTPFFISDDLGDYSLQLRQIDIERETSKGTRSPTHVGASSSSPGTCVFSPAHASNTIFREGRAALQAVADPLGEWNWVLVKSDPEALPLVAGGTGSVDEMSERLRCDHEQDVLFGLLRLGFGTGRLRRTKHVFVHAVGKRVPAVTRGRLSAARPQMGRAIAKLAHCSCVLEVSCAEDLTLEAVIEKVRRASVVDDEVIDRDKSQRNAYTVEAFREALREEQKEKCSSTKEPSSQSTLTSWTGRPVEEVVGLVHALDGPLTWALFGPNPRKAKRRTPLDQGQQRTSPLTPPPKEQPSTPASVGRAG